MIRILNIKLLLVIVALLTSVASYSAYRWRQDVAREKRIQDFYKQMDQKRKADEAILNATQGWADSIKNHRNK